MNSAAVQILPWRNLNAFLRILFNISSYERLSCYVLLFIFAFFINTGNWCLYGLFTSFRYLKTLQNLFLKMKENIPILEQSHVFTETCLLSIKVIYLYGRIFSVI